MKGRTYIRRTNASFLTNPIQAEERSIKAKTFRRVVRLHVQEHDIDPNSPVVYMALSLLCYSQNGLVPELMYLPSPKQIVDFIKVFGEETVRTPTRDEFSRDLVAALAAHHTMVERQ